MPCVPSSVGWRASKTFMNFLLRLKNYFISNIILQYLLLFSMGNNIMIRILLKKVENIT